MVLRIDDGETSAQSTLLVSLFILRYRDAEPSIRAECVQEFGVWLEKYPAFFLEGSHLRYVGWVLSDAVSLMHAEKKRDCNLTSYQNTQVRIAAVKALKALYKRSEYLTSINHFTQRFKPRMVTMATSDTDISVRVAMIDILCAIDALGELEEDQTDTLELLIFDQEARVRRAVSGFVHNVWKNAVDERMTKRRASQSQGDADRAKAGFKCLGALLVKWAKALEKEEGEEVNSEQAESQEAGSDTEATGYKGKEVTALVSDLQRSRIALCVDSLWDEIEAVSDWEGLVDFLLLDHSAKGDEDAVASPVASKRKKAAESSARNRKGKAKTVEADGEADELWRLDDAEEAVMVEILVASLKKNIGDASSEKKKVIVISFTEERSTHFRGCFSSGRRGRVPDRNDSCAHEVSTTPLFEASSRRTADIRSPAHTPAHEPRYVYGHGYEQGDACSGTSGDAQVLTNHAAGVRGTLGRRRKAFPLAFIPSHYPKRCDNHLPLPLHSRTGPREQRQDCGTRRRAIDGLARCRWRERRS